MSSNRSKKGLGQESIGNYFTPIPMSHIPSGTVLLADEQYLWIGVGRVGRQPCIDCFLSRYRNWRLAQIASGTGDYQSLDPSGDPCLSLHNNSEPLIAHCIAKASTHAALDTWSYFTSDGAFIASGTIVPNDRCNDCCDVWANSALNLPTSLDELASFLADSFGLTSAISLFENPMSVPESPPYMATVLAVMERFGEYEPILCSGQDRQRAIAHLKACMEYIERYAQTNRLVEQVASREQGESAIYEQCDDHLWRSLLSPALSQQVIEPNEMLVGQNIMTGNPALIPLYLVYERSLITGESLFSEEAAVLAPTTNGFAAHCTRDKATEHGMLELIERDAAMRWWCDPMRAQKISINAQLTTRCNAIAGYVSAIGGVDVQVMLFSLEATVDIPVVLALATSSSNQAGPALLVGSAAAYNWEDAAQKALDELTMGVYNFTVHQQKNMPPQEHKSDFSWVRVPSDHASLYYDNCYREQLGFLEILVGQAALKKPGAGLYSCYDDLLHALNKKAMPAYALNATPRFAQQAGVVVTRVVMPSLYPLQFGFGPAPADKLCSPLGAAKSLPHCFF